MAEIYADAAAAAVGADDSDEELGAPAGAFVPPGNPFSPASAASRAPPNEERLMQVLENLTTLVSNNTAAPREQAIRGRDLAKVLKAPEPFRRKDRDAELSLWANWSWELEQYLSCLDRAFGVELQTIRRRPANPIALASLTEAEADRSRLLYGVLAGLLHDKGKRVLKSLTDANGFEAYRILSQDLMPSSRNRILALLQAIHSWPAFDNRTGLMTQLTRFESAVNEYEGLTGTSMSDDNRLAAVLRCLSGQLRTQATVLITESSTYQDLRNLIERWDTSQTKWSTSIASTFGIASSSSGGPAPMEIDRVAWNKGKPKGKGDKGKCKPKGKGHGGKPQGGKGGKNQGKPKGKGKGGNTPKGPPPATETRTCRYCERKGHLEKDCWLKQKHEKGRVNQVSEVQPSDSASQAAASSTATTAVRRVQVFDLGDTSSWFAGGHVRAVIAEPGLRAKAIQCPTGCMPRGISEFSDFDFLDAMRASHLGLGYPVSDVLTISGVERFECSDGLSDCLDNIFNGFESRGNPVPTGRFEFYDQCSVPEGPILLEQDQCSVPEGPGSECDHSFDMSACDANAGSWCIAASTFDLQDESDCSGIPQFVCAVHSIDMLVHDSEAHEIILDSGADMSCLPLCYATHGTSQGAGGLALKDAQGEPLAVNDLREVDFVLQSEEGEPIVWREVCAIAPVTQPLLCKGKLMRAGWWPQRKPTMCLEHDSGIRVPMSFKGNSLCIKAAIYRVGEQSVNPALHVRFVQATIDASMIDAPFGWQMSEQGDMFFRGRGSHFIDPSIVAPVGWPCRTTLVKPCRDGYDHWLLLEHCVSWGELQELSAVLPHGESDVVCVLTTDRAPLEDMMIVPSRSVKDYISWSGPQPADPNAGELDEYEPSDDGMAEAFEPAEVSVSPLPDVEVADAPMPERKSERDVLVYDGVELSLASTLNVIRASCKAAGLSQSGSKQRCLDRFKCYLEKQDIALKSEVAQAVEGDSTRVAKGQAMNKEPSKAERDLHNLIHWPFQGWCDHCLSMRGLEDRHQSIPDSPDRDTPIVSFDFCYTSVTTDDSDLQHHKLTILVAHDTATGSVFGLPVASKGKDGLKFAAIELTRFVQSLGHNTIALQTDNEPSTVALQNLIISVRTRLNFKTVVRNAAVESHASKGYVEKTVDLLRGLSNVFLDQARAKFGLGPDHLGPSHPLMAWSYVHAAFILNRFAVRGGATAFERATGFRYSGKLGMYAEPVWGYRKGKHKGDRRWHRALMLTKSPSNDMYVLCNSAGVWLTKSIRRNDKPWESEQSLAIDAKGFPWDYQLGLLGTKVVPQARHRVPKPADKGEPDAPQGEVQVEAPRMPDMPAMAGIPPAPVPAESVQPPSVAAGTPAPSSRATLLLDRSDRAPTSVVEPAARKFPTPCTKELLMPDASKELDSARAAKYRSAVGIGMYVSQDRSDIAFTVRVLAQNLKAPTERGWQFAQRLAGYLVGTAGYASKVHAKGDRASILEPPDAEECLDGVRLEVFCDADWSGNKQTRRSMSSSSFFLNSCCVYTSCKSQRCVSLSSAESEFYALVSAACDGIYLKRVLEYLLELPVDLLMRTDNSSCRQISLKQGVSKIRHLDGRFLWIQEKTADRTLRVQPVDGRRNPSDLGTKVPCSGSRLRALLCMHDFVCCAGDCIEEVGRAEHDALLEQLQRERETQRVRRLVCKTLKSNGMQSFSTAMMVMMLSLVQGAESSGTRREVGVQTDDDARWAQSLAVLVICTCAILLALKSLSLGRLWTTEGNEDDITLNMSNASTSTEEVYEQGTDGWWNWVPLTFTCSLSAFCLAIMMCLRRVRASLHAAEQENERLSRLIAEMNYDRIAWGEYHEAKDRTRERTLPMPEPNRAIFIDGDAARGSNDVIQHVPELHVYCTLRRGKSYHKSRNCTCLNNADEIVKLGIATARERGYKPCGSCFGGSKKQK
ncbi:unnamed protein product [Symbiodinium sp. CCMP2592]|nr:unnamed protein product [Symbiodinium sp. CCMP2592]